MAYNIHMKETVEIEVELQKRTRYTRFVVTSGYGWGISDSLVAAKKACKTQTPHNRATEASKKPVIYRAKLVTQDTTLTGDGSISYFPEYPPIELGEV